MKKTITKLMAALALLLFVAPPMVGWGQTSNEVTYTFSQHYNANTTLTDVAIAFDDNITATFHKGSGSTAPQYYTNGTAVRWYGGNTLDITATNATISAIEFTYTQKNKDVTADVGEYNHDEGTWTGSESSVTFTVASGSGHNRVSEIKVTYTTSGGTPAPSITAENVEIAYDATEGAIAYTINDGVEGGVLTAATEAEWLEIGEVGETVPFTCSVNDNGERTATVTLTYTFNTDQTVTKNVTVTQATNPNGPGSEANPYTVAQARAAIDAGTGTQGVYATGIVSAIPTAYNPTYENVTFNMVDEEGDEVFLQAYRCGGAEAANVAVGDVVVVYGNLTYYANGGIYEFAQGCEVVSLEHPVVTVAAPTFSPVGGTYIEAQTVEISTATEGADIYYTLDGTDPDMNSTMYDNENPIVVSTTTTIKAVAVDGDDNFSSVASATYTIVPESNISSINEVGTAYNVRGTVVATNSKGFIMGDGTGYVYYYKNGAPTQSVGDMVRVYGTTGTYGHIIQFTNTATVAEATASNYNGSPAATLITEVPDYAEDYHLSDYFEFDGAMRKTGNNYFIAFGDSLVQISYPTTAQGTTMDDLNDKQVHVKGYFSGINSSGKFTVMLESVEEVLEPSISITPASLEVPIEGASGSFTLTLTAVELNTDPIFWCDADSTIAEYNHDWITTTLTESGINYVISANSEEYDRVAYFLVKGHDADNNEILSELVTITQAHQEALQPSITVDPLTVNLSDANEALGELGVSASNFQLSEVTYAWFDFYEPDGNGGYIEIEEEANEPQWIDVDIQSPYVTITYLVEANDGDARTAYFKLAFSLGGSQVFSDMITISQPAYVAPTSSTGTITFGSATGSTNINGVSVTGDDNLGNEWTITVEGNNPYISNSSSYAQVGSSNKPATSITFTMTLPQEVNITAFEAKFGGFNGTAGDITLKVGEATVGSGSLNASNDVTVTNTTQATGTTLTVTVTNISKGVKCYYISYTYVNGEPQPVVASITVEPAEVNVDAEEHDGTLDITLANFEVSSYEDFIIQFYDADENELNGDDEPAWIDVTVAEQDPEIGEGYVVSYYMYENTGEARTAYFTVNALNGNDLVESNLVTITQEAYVAQTAYSYSINGVEGETIEVEAGATITLQEGTDLNLNEDFTFAGWTTDANDVSQRLTGEYTLTEEVTVFYAVYAHTTTIGSTVTRDAASYVKVTSTDELEDGNYLIVYEEGGVAFNGGLETLDAVGNTIEVSIDNGVIAANENVDASVFTIAAMDEGYSILSASGLYIGQNSNANGLATSEAAITNTITITEGEDADIVSSSAHLRYNSASNQTRFRYYKSSSYTNQQAIQLYKYTTGETPTPTPQPVTETNYYTRVFFTSEAVTSDIQIIGPSIVPSGNQLDMFSALGSYAIINDNPANLIIEGEVLSGEIQFNGTMLKNITACDYNENNSAGYYLIASPIDNFVPSIDNGFITDQYDLYAYNATQDLEWINFKDESNNFTSLQSNKGYLYANGVNTTLKFAGLLTGSYHTIIENLDYADGDNEAKRLTLIGNSSTYDLKCEVENSQYQSVTTNFLTLNESGDGFIVSESNYYNAEPMESFFVYAYEGGLRVLAYNSTLGYPWGGNVGGDPVPGGGGPVFPGGPDDGFIAPNSHLNITVSGTVSGQRGSALLDNAIVSFGEGNTMKKLYLSENSTRVYIPQSNNDYAVVRSAAQGEMPVNFKASKNDSYTLAIDAENVEMNYLHLIDNMTGADVDLLATPSYTFDAKTTDYASRFKLVFSANANENDDENETFAFFNGSVWCISNTGEATLQVVDMLGRIVSSESVNGNATLSTDNLMSGVYMFRLVNGENVKVQKVVVK